jgi:hypothetical protein
MTSSNFFIFIKDFINEKLKTCNSYQLYNTFLKNYDDKSNLLIGATNSDNNDYARFINSKYSIFIDVSDYIPEREYKMFCIKLSDFKGFDKPIFNNIHFDLNVSYFCSINQYINLTFNLKKNCSMVFELINRINRNLYIINDDNMYINIITRRSINEKQFIKEYNIHNINHETKIIQINFDPDKYPILSGEYSLSVKKQKFEVDELYYIQYEVDELYFFNSYAIWASNRFPRSFRATLKSYTYMNYTYPVDIRQNITESNNLVHTYYNEIDYVCNNLMNKREKDIYLSVKNLTDSQIEYLLNKKQNPSYTEEQKNKIKSIFKKVHYFLEITRI